MHRSLAIAAALLAPLALAVPSDARPPVPGADPAAVAVSPASAIVSAFTTGPGAIVDTDDRRVPSEPAATPNTWLTPVTTTGAQPRLGAVSAVRRYAPQTGTLEYPTVPLVSGSTTALPSAAALHHIHYLPDYQIPTESLTVTAPHRTRTITDVILGAYDSEQRYTPQLSGNRLVYYAQTGSTPHYFVYDVATDSVTDLTEAYGIDHQPALSGNDLVYVTDAGEVLRRDLNTGATQQVVPAPGPTHHLSYAFVFSRGDYVAWDLDFRNYATVGYRDARTMSAPVILDSGSIDSLSALGPIVTTPDPQTNGLDYTLHTYGSQNVALPDQSGEDATWLGPTIEGSEVAWVDGQQLRVSALPVQPAAPFFEGASLAPEPAHPDTVAWHLYAPFSEPLTSCAVTVTGNASTVAQLPCNAAAMARGVADVEWDGRVSGSGRAPAGRYHYTITASGDGGGALDSAGTTAPVAGHFTIGG